MKKTLVKKLISSNSRDRSKNSVNGSGFSSRYRRYIRQQNKKTIVASSATIAMLLFTLALAVTFPFKDNLYSLLFPKSPSLAAAIPPTYLQGVTSQISSPGTTVSTSFSQPTTTGNFLMATITANAGGGVVSVSAAPSGWVQASNNTNGGGLYQFVYYYPNAPSQSGNVSFILNTSAKASIVLAEYKDIAAANPLDNNTTSTGTNATPTNSLTPTAADRFIITALSSNSTVTFATPSAGFTIATQSATIGGTTTSNAASGIMHQFISSITPVVSSVQTGMSSSWIATSLAFMVNQTVSTSNTTVSSGLPAGATDWPQLQGDAAHSGYLADTYGPPYTVLWRRDEKSSPAAPPVSVRVQPVIANNLVYVPSNNGGIYAYKTSDGSVAWKFQTGGPLVASAGVDNGIVFVGSQDTKVYALDALTGALKWSYQTTGRIRVAPVIANSTVYMGSNDGNIYALDETTGTLKWQQSVTYPVWETPAFYNGNLYVANMGAQAIALNGSTGAVIWQQQLKGQGSRDRWVVAGNGKVIFTTVPINGSNNAQADGSNVLTPIYTSSWATQRQAILDHFTQSPFFQPVFVLDPATGVQTTPPILYTSGGSTSEHPQPVVLPNGNFNTLYRYTEGIANPGCGATCIMWSQYLGEFSPSTNDITQVDTWGSTTSTPDTTKKITGHTDESTALSRSGNIIYVATSRGIEGFDTVAKSIIPFVSFDTGTGYPYLNPPVIFYPSASGWVGQYPGEEADSDGNDYTRPAPIANGVFYILHNSVLLAVQGTKK